MKRAWSILIAFLGCCPPKYEVRPGLGIKLSIEKSCTNPVIPQIVKQAIDVWKPAGAIFYLADSPIPGEILESIDGPVITCQDDISKFCNSPNAQACYTNNDSIVISNYEIRIRQENNSIDFMVAIIAHELGHVMGLKHVRDPNALMFPNGLVPNFKPNATDLTQLCEVQGNPSLPACTAEVP